MRFRKLGKAGIYVSELSVGSWITFGNQLSQNDVNECLRIAFDHGINFFDTAEAYAGGIAEKLLGVAIKDYRREDLVISTKIYWGGPGPNDTGLSRKHLIEGTKNSLKRLGQDYVDLLFCHRPDPTTPIEETVRAMDTIVRSGMALYWGTSEWESDQIEAAYRIAYDLNAIPPSMEQPEYNLFHRNKVERDFLSLYKTYGMGLTIWSPLASGVLTGKYQKEIPKESRLSKNPEMLARFTEERRKTVSLLHEYAKKIGCSLVHLSIAWCLKNPHVSSVILGISNREQLLDNLKAIEYKDLISDDVLRTVDAILEG